jgi:hypothetical protein
MSLALCLMMVAAAASQSTYTTLVSQSNTQCCSTIATSQQFCTSATGALQYVRVQVLLPTQAAKQMAAAEKRTLKHR